MHAWDIREAVRRRNWVRRVREGHGLLWLECPPEGPHPHRRLQVGSIWACTCQWLVGSCWVGEMIPGLEAEAEK